MILRWEISSRLNWFLIEFKCLFCRTAVKKFNTHKFINRTGWTLILSTSWQDKTRTQSSSYVILFDKTETQKRVKWCNHMNDNTKASITPQALRHRISVVSGGSGDDRARSRLDKSQRKAESVGYQTVWTRYLNATKTSPCPRSLVFLWLGHRGDLFSKFVYYFYWHVTVKLNPLWYLDILWVLYDSYLDIIVFLNIWHYKQVAILVSIFSKGVADTVIILRNKPEINLLVN